jgi:hypothetical protein
MSERTQVLEDQIPDVEMSVDREALCLVDVHGGRN